MSAVRIVSPHLELGPDDDYHEWWQDRRAPLVGVDRAGRRNPRMLAKTWQPWRCNNPDCTAEALVNEEWIARAIDTFGVPCSPRSSALLLTFNGIRAAVGNEGGSSS